MYSEATIERNLEEFEAREGWFPRYHTYDEVREFTAYINGLLKTESNTKSSYYTVVKELSEKRQKEITRWVLNEQALCNPPEAPIWMADFTFKPIGDIQPGDRIIGWQRSVKKANRKSTKSPKNLERLVRTTVVAVGRRKSPIVRVTMESGRVIRCTPDHLWSCGATYRGECPWQSAKIGRLLRRVVDVYSNEPADIRLAGWLGGIYDGEGHKGSIHQSPFHNADVCEAIESTLSALNFSFSVYRAANKTEKGKDRRSNCYQILGGVSVLARFAAWCKPCRNDGLDARILRTMRASTDRIINVEPDGEGEVVSMQTETGNYIVWGYASKNCGLDSGYWERNYAWVCDEKGQIFKFKNRKSQEVFDSIIAEFDEKGVSIELLILKARQVGISTKTALKFIHRLMFIPHTQAVMASVQKDKSELIGRILDTAYNRCPWWLVPNRMPRRSFDNGSILSIQSGMQATGLAQGWTPTSIHISELADIPNPKVTIEEGLFRAAHSSRNLFMVLEGTGGGNTGWLADTWRAAKEDWPKGLARLFPMFIPWAMCPDIYPEPDWLLKFPLPGGFQPHEMTRKHVIKCESYIRNTPYLSRIAGRDWRMPMEQKWFWQFNYDEACKKHTQRTWAAQMPADDHEALTGIHDSVFDPEVLMEVEDRIYEIAPLADQRQRKQPMQIYAITGHDVDEVFHPPDARIDWDKPCVKVEWDSYRGQHFDWNMIPLLAVDEEKERDTLDYLLVYEWPKHGCQYSCGVDTADGLGKEDEERSCLSVTKNRFHGECDQQVAELTSNRINSAQIVAFAACVGALYGPCCPDSRGLKYCIEQIQGPGDTCQHQLKMMGFFNHHIPRRYDSKKIKDDSSRKEGWYSNTWSVPIMMTRFTEAVNGGWYEPRSRWLIEELRTLERHETAGKSKMEHQTGKFDDRVRAAATSYFTVHDMDVLTERAQKRYAQPVKKPSYSKNLCRATQVSVGGW
jgi:hypothetical protein